jgi:hypothetical protein
MYLGWEETEKMIQSTIRNYEENTRMKSFAYYQHWYMYSKFSSIKTSNVCALEVYEQTWMIWTRALGDDHPDTGISLNNTDDIYQKKRNTWRHLSVINVNHHNSSLIHRNLEKVSPFIALWSGKNNSQYWCLSNAKNDFHRAIFL